VSRWLHEDSATESQYCQKRRQKPLTFGGVFVPVDLMKTGRKQKHWTNTKTGKPIDGLTRRPDGRWRIIGTQITYTEHDEQRAIERFYNLKTHGLNQQEIDELKLEPVTYVGSPAFAMLHGFYDDLMAYLGYAGIEYCNFDGYTDLETVGYLYCVPTDADYDCSSFSQTNSCTDDSGDTSSANIAMNITNNSPCNSLDENCNPISSSTSDSLRGSTARATIGGFPAARSMAKFALSKRSVTPAVKPATTAAMTVKGCGCGGRENKQQKRK
jgi:hypothetical protein